VAIYTVQMADIHDSKKNVVLNNEHAFFRAAVDDAVIMTGVTFSTGQATHLSMSTVDTLFMK